MLFSQGEEAKGYLAPVDRALFEAMAAGRMLTLSFDISSAKGADGSDLETFARFDLAGAGALIGEAVKACG